MERTYQSNRGAYNEVKTQQNQINQMVTQNSIFDLKDKQMKFQKVKDNQSRAKSHFVHKIISN